MDAPAHLPNGSSVLVVGAGIVGLACAFWLTRAGFRVTVVDADPSGDKASFGNAGSIAVAEVVPASQPGLAWRVPGWLLDPLGPLSLRPAHAFRMLPWLLRFLRAGRPAEVERISAQLAALNAVAEQDIETLLHACGLRSDVRRTGALALYETDSGFERDAGEWALRRRAGIAAEPLGADEARELEPALGPLVRRAVHVPGWSQVSDPKRIVDGMRGALAQAGVAFATACASAIEPAERPKLRLDGGDALAADAIVVAAGAWSGVLAATLGDRVLLESERGYNMTFAAAGIELGRPLIFAERRFVATPLSTGLRVGGAVEFAGLAAPARMERADALVRAARRYLPTLPDSGGRPWMGQRPSTPDSLPVIGRSPRHASVLYAFGHGHLGLTQSSTTGRLIAEVVAGRAPSLDLAPFSIGRFR